MGYKFFLSVSKEVYVQFSWLLIMERKAKENTMKEGKIMINQTFTLKRWNCK